MGQIVPIRRKLASWWQERSERERRILAVWAAGVAALVLWFGIFAPLFSRIDTLEKQAPELEMQLGRMRTPPPAGKAAAARQGGEDLRSVLFNHLAESRISAELRPLSPARVEMRLPEMPMKDALDALDVMRRQTGVRVVAFGARSDGSAGGAARIVVELERNP